MYTPNQKIGDYVETQLSRSRWVTILGIFPGGTNSQEVTVRFIPLYATYIYTYIGVGGWVGVCLCACVRTNSVEKN